MNRLRIARPSVSRNAWPALLFFSSSLACVIGHWRAMIGSGGVTEWLPAILLGAGMLFWLILRFNPPAWRGGAARRWLDQSLTRVEWQIFSNQVIVLDGKSFMGCSFSDATLCYKGDAPFDFVNNHTSNVRLVVEHPRLFMLVQLLRYFGWIDRRAPITDGESKISYFGQQVAGAKNRPGLARPAAGSSADKS